MAIIPYRDCKPKLSTSTFVAPDAWVIGDVSLGENSSVFYGAVLRGDINPIKVGDGTNIQEHALVHTSHGLGECVIGDLVTVGHRVILHGCRISSHCIIGMGSTILDGAQIGEFSIVGANSLVTMNKNFPARSLIMGSPAVVIREITEKEIEQIRYSAKSYIETSAEYLRFFLNY